MATYPPGVISFLYNVINDAEMNEKFRDNEYEVMEFFMLDDKLRQVFTDGGEKFKEHQREQKARKKAVGSSDPLSYKEVQQFAEDLFAEPLSREKLETIFAAIEKELKECFGRMW